MLFLSLIPIWITVVAALTPLLLPAGANFEYEYHLYAAWVEVFLWVLARSVIKKNPWKNRPVFLFHMLTFYAPLVSLIPGVFAFATRSCACNPIGFFIWWAILWLPARSVGFIFFSTTGSLFKKKATFVRLGYFFGAYLGLWLLLALTLWAFPQKRVVHAVFGFLHGPIYDAYISLDAGVVLRRLSLVVLSLSVLVFYYIKDIYNRRCLSLAFLLLFLGLVVGSGHFASTQLGHAALRSEFTESASGSGIQLYFNQKSKDSSEILSLQRQAEFHFRDICWQLGLGTDEVAAVRVYVYDDANHKKISFGGYNTDIADVFGSSIHITRRLLPHATLRHELVHAILAHKAPLGLGFRVNMAMTEGVAVALESSPRERSVHELAATLMLGQDKPPKLSDLFSPWFWRQPPAHAYGIAGSFFKFLLETHGGPKLLDLYAGKSFEHSYGASIEELEKNWLSYLEKVFKGDSSRGYFQRVLSQQSQLDLRCPHSREINQRSRDKGFWLRLRQPLGWDPKIDYHPWALSNFKIGSDEQVTDMDFSFLSTRIKEEMDQNQYAQVSVKKWLVDVSSMLRTPFNSRLQAKLRLLRSDLLSVDDRWDESEKVLEELVQELQIKELGVDLYRAAEARLRLASLTSVKVNKQWRRYLAGWRKNPPGFQGDGSVPWLVEYLYLRSASSKVSTGKSLAEMIDAFPEHETISTLHKSFYFEYFRKLAELSLYERQNLKLAKKAAEKAKTYSTPNQAGYVAMLLRATSL